MSKKRDYDVVVGKVPRKDKYGNDITGDKLEVGGRRRKNNTYSGMVYDLKEVDEDKSTVRSTNRESIAKKYEDFSPGGKLIIDVADMDLCQYSRHIFLVF